MLGSFLRRTHLRSPPSEREAAPSVSRRLASRKGMKHRQFHSLRHPPAKKHPLLSPQETPPLLIRRLYRLRLSVLLFGSPQLSRRVVICPISSHLHYGACLQTVVCLHSFSYPLKRLWPEKG